MTSIRGVSVGASDPLTWTPSYSGPARRDPGAVGLRVASSGPGGEPALPRERMLSDVLHWEGDIHHLYLDNKGLVTVGIGNLVSSAAAAEDLPFVNKGTGAPATREQIAAAFQAVSQLPKGRHAPAYSSATDVRLPEHTVRQLASERLDNEFLPGLRRLFPGFDKFPAAAQRALVDMSYNLGIEGLGRFHDLRKACESGDWQGAATECHRRTCRAERNDWTRQLFLDAGAAPSSNA